MYDINSVKCSEVRSAQVGVLNSSELRSISMGKFENEVFEYTKATKSGSSAIINYDPRFGTVDSTQICSVCFEKHVNCLGHIGHIEFVLPLFNPIFYKDLLELLSMICYHCYSFLCSEDVIFILKHIFQLKALNEIESTNKLICGKRCDYEYIADEIEKLYKKICKESDITMDEIAESIYEDYEGLRIGEDAAKNDDTKYTLENMIKEVDPTKADRDRNRNRNRNRKRDRGESDDENRVKDESATNGDCTEKNENAKNGMREICDEENRKARVTEESERIDRIKERIKKYKFDTSKLAFQGNYNYEEYVILSKTLRMIIKKKSKCSSCGFRKNVKVKKSAKRDTMDFTGFHTNNNFFKKYMPKKGKKEEEDILGESDHEEGRQAGTKECVDSGKSGNRESGNRKSGNRESGNRKSGNRKSGNRESGNSESENRESGNHESGNRNGDTFEREATAFKDKVKEQCTVRLFSFQVIDILKKVYKKENKEILDLLYPFTKRDGYKAFFLYDMGISANRFRSVAAGVHKKTKFINIICKLNEFVHLCINSKKEIDFDYLVENKRHILNLYNDMFNQFSLKSRNKINYSVIGFDVELKREDFLKNYSLVYENKSAYINILFCNLQIRVNTFFDSSISNSTYDKNTRNSGLRDILDKKEGILRKNIMGKRVNYCARTVISPDTFIETNQIGIPMEFALKLTVDEYVTINNLDYIKKIIENGPYIYPGALSYRDSKGRVFKLSSEYENRMKVIKDIENNLLSKNDKTIVVHRHARDGDIVIMNRQPTLHKFSIMAHFIKIFKKEKVFRLNYVNCSSYNADFDGDEMNLHLLQTPLARAEATHLMNSDFLFTSFKDGSPLRGLAQDFILGGLHLTSLETFLCRDEYCNLLQCSLNCLLSQKNSFYFGVPNAGAAGETAGETSGEAAGGGNSATANAMGSKNLKISNYSYLDPYASVLNRATFRIVTEEPAVLFPKRLWTGKQLITSILKTVIDVVAVETFGKGDKKNYYMANYKGINYVSRAKTDADLWSFDPDKEYEVIIKNSELLQGVLDKLHFGASSNSFVHLCHELFGPKTAAVMLDCFGRLFISFLQLRGTSLSLYDFILKKKARDEKREIKKRISFTGFYLQNLFIHSISKSLNADINHMNSYREKKRKNYQGDSTFAVKKLHELYRQKSSIIQNGKREMSVNWEKEDHSRSQSLCTEQQSGKNDEAYILTLLYNEIENARSENCMGKKLADEEFTGMLLPPLECILSEEKLCFLEKHVKEAGGAEEAEEAEEAGKDNNAFASSAMQRLYNALKEPTVLHDTGWRGKKVMRVIQRVVDFLKKARCSKRLKVYILFEIFQNKNVTKYFPSLVSFLNDFSHEVSNEEVVKNVASNVYLEGAATRGASTRGAAAEGASAIMGGKGGYVKGQERGSLPSSGRVSLRPDNWRLSNSSNHGINSDSETAKEVEMFSSIEDERAIKNSLVDSFPSFILNEEIKNLSYIMGKYQYYENYIKKKNKKKNNNFEYYDMKDIYYKTEYIINNYFTLDVNNFNVLIDSLFQPYLCKISSNSNNLINMKNILNKFLYNGFSNMIFTGAKGSKVNYAMICGMLDQQYLDGKRVPRMKSGKTLPCFHKYDYGARSCGLITDCFLEGLRPQEYFFHCMSGREGLIDTAVKTAKSGYIQRCLIKCMESVILHYDGTVRNEDNTIIQFLYGEDGIDPSKTAYLNSSTDLIRNYNLSFSKYLQGNIRDRIRSNEGLFRTDGEMRNGRGSSTTTDGRMQNGRGSSTTTEGEMPQICTYNPYTYIGSVSDTFRKKLSNIVFNQLYFPHADDLPQNFDTLSMSLLKSKYFNSLCSPGESIGILVAQSFGEPATQMTLNTFHLAGTENVTMGIPRLKEIFLTSKLTSKPMIYVPIKMEEDVFNEIQNDMCDSAERVKTYINGIADKILSSYRSIFLSEAIYGVGVDRKLILRNTSENNIVHCIDLSRVEEYNLENYQSNHVHSNIDTDVQVAKIMNLLKNVNLTFDMKKEWNHEITIQFENLNHFCKINSHINIPMIIYKTVHVILSSVLTKVQECLVFHNAKCVEEFNHEYYDELYDFISTKLEEDFNFSLEKMDYKNDEDEINAKLKFMTKENYDDDIGRGDNNNQFTNLRKKYKRGEGDTFDDPDVHTRHGDAGGGAESNEDDFNDHMGERAEEMGKRSPRENDSDSDNNHTEGGSRSDEEKEYDESGEEGDNYDNDGSVGSGRSGRSGGSGGSSESDGESRIDSRIDNRIDSRIGSCSGSSSGRSSRAGRRGRRGGNPLSRTLSKGDSSSSETSVTHHVLVEDESDDSLNAGHHKMKSVKREKRNNVVEGNKKGFKKKLKEEGIESTIVSSSSSSPLSGRSTPMEEVDEVEEVEEVEEVDEDRNTDGETPLEDHIAKSFSQFSYDYSNNIHLNEPDESGDEEGQHDKCMNAEGKNVEGSHQKKNNEHVYRKGIVDKIKSSLLCCVKRINFSPITWTMTFEIAWDIDFFPFSLDFLDLIKTEIMKEVLFRVTNLNNPKILKGVDITHSGSEYELQIEGKNIYKLYNIKDKYIDKTKLYCNDAYTIVKTYGIEAGRVCITKELKKVFSAYGIQIDFRHLSFISDFMTHTGELKSFSRHSLGLFRNVFHKMSFECATNFLVQGCVQNSVDYLMTPSSSLFFGKHVKVGTNLSDVITCLRGNK
ncbi:RNA polymerase I, putative [Plasmodium ovale]|uniref:DNA-directed RNA polymerase subunit n=1 Tax=Plasmodium ovale TaxID=36330 RepID=A0A1C3KKV4_PLAOA|nr:RNA polymerase I, putative [Plasmodium ovale]